MYQKGDTGKEKKPVLSTILLSHSSSDTTPIHESMPFLQAFTVS